MLSFTGFQALIMIAYGWFFIGAIIISIFAAKELFFLIKKDK